MLQDKIVVKKINIDHYLVNILVLFTPKALKGCHCIVFTHGVGAGWPREKVCPGCISETVRCKKFIVGRYIG